MNRNDQISPRPAKDLDNFRLLAKAVDEILTPADTTLPETLQNVVKTLKQGLGLDAVGIRLQDGDRFPYFVEDGLCYNFCKTDALAAQPLEDDATGEAPALAPKQNGLCGQVLSGLLQGLTKHCSPGGSFWVNNANSLDDSESASPNPLQIPSHCRHPGFASVALVPIRKRNKVVGLIFLADGDDDRFSLAKVEILEGIAGQIGRFLLLRQAEEAYRSLQDQFLQTQKMESVGRLAGGVIHDFNNMLGVILGYSQIALHETDPSSPSHYYLQQILDASNRSVQITQQLLGFIRKQPHTPKAVNLNKAIEEGSLRILRRLIGEQIELSWRPRANLWLVRIDPSQVDQILTNLCINARDAINGPGKIEIFTDKQNLSQEFCAAYPQAMPGAYVSVSVRDDGPGIDKNSQSRLFEIFYTTKGPEKGTGLGLSTIYGIVSQNNGIIDVQSQPGKGATFTIYLPRFQEAEEISPLLQEDQRKLAKGSETILLVEDEKAIIDLTATVLKQYGYTMLTAGSPAKALQVAQDYPEKIDLLISDFILPEMNGKELAQRLLQFNPKMKVLFMSGYPQDVVTSQYSTESVVNFIGKPFFPEELANKVRTVIEC